jgi:hypothetical protein
MTGGSHVGMDIAATPDEGFLRVRVTGVFSLEHANRAFARMIEEVIRHGATRVLVDCRELRGDVPTVDLYEHASFAAVTIIEAYDRGLSTLTRLAYVARPDTRNHFGVIVARNRGVCSIDDFDSLEDALQWLIPDANEGAESG